MRIEEIMREFETEIKTDDGVMDVFVCHPEQDGPHPAVILYMDAPGIREELRDMARRMGTVGYTVLLPNMYYRTGREGHYGYDLARFRDDEGERAKMFEVMNTLTNARVVHDTKGLLAFIDQCEAAAAGPVGCVGYCMSGRFITCAAGTFPDIFKASASLYGVGIVTDQDDSSHYMVKHITGEIYFGFAETDGTVPSFVHPTLQAELKEHGTNAIFEVHPGTGHGFCFESRDVYDKAAAEKVWKVFFDMCKRNLG